MNSKLRNYGRFDKLFVLMPDAFQLGRGFGYRYVVMDSKPLYKQWGVSLHFTAFLCTVSYFSVFRLVYYIILSLNLIDYRYNYTTTGEMG